MKKEEIKCFKNHVATIVKYIKNEKKDIEVLIWKNPKSITYMIKYIISDGTLCVYGDLGEAIYKWSQPITFEWLYSLDLSYFAKNCEASEVGRSFNHWNSDIAIKKLKAYAKEGIFDWKEFEKDGGAKSTDTKEGWIDWLSNQVYGIDNPVIDDRYFCRCVCDVGKVIHYRCEHHFYGLQMAMEQIKKKENKEVSEIV